MQSGMKMVFRALLLALVVGGAACSSDRVAMTFPLQIMMDGSSEYFILDGGFHSESRRETIAKIRELHERTGFDVNLFCFITPHSSWGSVFSFFDEARELGFVKIVIYNDYSVEGIEQPVPLSEVLRIDEAEGHK